MTDYLSLARTLAPQQDTTPTNDNPYMAIARDEQAMAANRLQTVVETALRDDPDIAAERLRLSKQSGVPLRVVERNLDELRIKERARTMDLARMASESPVLARQMVDPTFTTPAIDDIPTLQKIEQSIGKGVAYVMGATPEGGLPSDAVDFTKDVALGATVGVGKTMFNLAATVNDMIGWQSGAAGMRGYAKRAQESMDFFGSQGQSSTAQAIRSGAQSAGQNLAMLPIGLERGLFQTAEAAASAVAAAMATGVGAEAFSQAREKGKSNTQALAFAIPQTAFEYVFEQIPASKLFKDIALNEGLLKTIGKQFVHENWTEQLTTLAQDFNEWMNLNPDKTMGQFIQERPEAIYQTFVATLVGVGVQTSALHGINKIVEKASNEQLVFQQDLLDAQMKLAAQSMLRQRSPEQFRAHVQNVIDENSNAKKEVYVDGEVLNQLAPELLNQLPQEVRDQIESAVAANSTVAIPMADVLTIAPGTELENILNEHARMTPDSASKAEAKLVNEMLRQDAERVLAEAQDQAAWQQSADNVKANLLDQLNTAGRFTPEVNEAYSTMVRDFYATLAGRQGITPEEMYQRYPLRIAAQGVGGQQLDQAFTATGKTDFRAGRAQAAQMFASFGGYSYDGTTLLKDGVRVADAKLRVDGNRLVIDDIEAARKGQGEGTAALRAIVAHAHQNGLTPALFTDAMRGKAQQKRLRGYYPRLGFVGNKGENKVKGLKEEFYYPPQQLNQSPIGDATEVEVDGKMRPALNQNARGTFNPDQLLITLNANADLSTFLHESAHFFLEVMADLASQPNAPADVQDDMGKLLKWFGIKGEDGNAFRGITGKWDESKRQDIEWWAPSRKDAETYAGEKGTVVSTSVELQNPLEIEEQNYTAEALNAAFSRGDVDGVVVTRDGKPIIIASFNRPTLARTPLEVWNAMTLDEKRVHHERFAESFEAYLLEGRAPSQELQPLFRKFRSWLVNVYKSLTHFMRGRDLKLSDEVRQVFDRMLAAEDAIKAQEEASGLLPDFDATNEAIEKLQARSLRDLKWTVNARNRALKALQKEAAYLRKAVEDEVRAEVEARPEVKAKRALSKLKKPSNLEIAAVADATGFESTEAMLKAIDDFGDIKAAIEGMTDQRMLENFGELATPEAIEEAANDAVHNEARAKSLATELKAQADMLNTREQTGTASNGRAVTVNALTRAAKEFGANLAARRKISDLKRAAQQHRAAEAKAGRAWQEATAKGQTQEAVAAKRDQVLNNAAVKALVEAQAEAKKIVEFFRKVTKDNNEKLVDKGRDPDVVNAMRAILAAYDVAPRLEKSATEYLELVARNDPAMYGALKPAVDAALASAKPLDMLTMEELRGLNDELRSMWHLAKRSRQMEIDGNLLDRQELEAELQARMQEIGVPDKMPGDTSGMTKAEKRQRALLHYLATGTRVESWADKMGPQFTRYVWNPVKDAITRYRKDKAEKIKALRALLEPVAPTLKRETIDAPELGYTFGKDEGTDGVGMNELLHAILHTGNDSNKRKLLLGRGWATENADGTLDTTRWDAFISRMHLEGKLTKMHWDFAQGVWDLLESTKALAQKTHRDVFGRYFDEVTANPVETPFGTYRGGYVPATADSRTVADAATKRLAEDESAAMQFAFPSTSKGFTKSRVEYNVKLRLDLRTLSQHLDKVLLFSHLESPVRDVRRILTAKPVAYSLNRIDPQAFDDVLTPWLNRASKQLVDNPDNTWQGWQMWKTLRNRAGMAAMFGNIANAVQQFAGISMAAVKVKPTSLLQASAQYVASPRETAQAVAEKSEYMNQRLKGELEQINAAVQDILLNPSVYESGKNWINRHAYFAQTAIDNVVGPIVWTGAYNDAIARGESEMDAVRSADAAVRMTQGATAPEDISSFESGSPFSRLFTQFAGYFNMQANLLGTEFAKVARDMGLRKGAGRALYVLTFGYLVNAWVAEAIMQVFKGGPDDDDKDGEYLDDWLAQVFGWSLVRSTTAAVPVFGQAANSAINVWNAKPYDDRLASSPVIGMLESAVNAPKSVYKAMVEDGKPSKALRDVGSAVALFMGLPLNPVMKSLGYVADVADNRVNPTSPVDAVRGTITGTASGESKR